MTQAKILCDKLDELTAALDIIDVAEEELDAIYNGTPTKADYINGQIEGIKFSIAAIGGKVEVKTLPGNEKRHTIKFDK